MSTREWARMLTLTVMGMSVASLTVAVIKGDYLEAIFWSLLGAFNTVLFLKANHG